jgi:hypothetical protein
MTLRTLGSVATREWERVRAPDCPDREPMSPSRSMRDVGIRSPSRNGGTTSTFHPFT